MYYFQSYNLVGLTVVIQNILILDLIKGRHYARHKEYQTNVIKRKNKTTKLCSADNTVKHECRHANKLFQKSMKSSTIKICTIVGDYRGETNTGQKGRNNILGKS